MFNTACAILLSVLVQTPAGVPAPDERVRGFVKAFNDRNIDAMLAAADDEIEWLSVNGPKISVGCSARR